MSTDNYCAGGLRTSKDEAGFSNTHVQARYLPICPLGVLSTNIQFIILKCKSTAKQFILPHSLVKFAGSEFGWLVPLYFSPIWEIYQNPVMTSPSGKRKFFLVQEKSKTLSRFFLSVFFLCSHQLIKRQGQRFRCGISESSVIFFFKHTPPFFLLRLFYGFTKTKTKTSCWSEDKGIRSSQL